MSIIISEYDHLHKRSSLYRMDISPYVDHMSTTCTIPRFQELSSSLVLPESPTTGPDAARELDELAQSIADTGIARHEGAIRRFANQLLGRRLDRRAAVLLDVLVDSDQPSVARERAFGHLHSLALTAQGNVGRHAA
jgi:hypothetical protein